MELLVFTAGILVGYLFWRSLRELIGVFVLGVAWSVLADGPCYLDLRVNWERTGTKTNSYTYVIKVGGWKDSGGTYINTTGPSSSGTRLIEGDAGACADEQWSVALYNSDGSYKYGETYYFDSCDGDGERTVTLTITRNDGYTGVEWSAADCGGEPPETEYTFRKRIENRSNYPKTYTVYRNGEPFDSATLAPGTYWDFEVTSDTKDEWTFETTYYQDGMPVGYEFSHDEDSDWGTNAPPANPGTGYTESSRPPYEGTNVVSHAGANWTGSTNDTRTGTMILKEAIDRAADGDDARNDGLTNLLEEIRKAIMLGATNNLATTNDIPTGALTDYARSLGSSVSNSVAGIATNLAGVGAIADPGAVTPSFWQLAIPTRRGSVVLDFGSFGESMQAMANIGQRVIAWVMLLFYLWACLEASRSSWQGLMETGQARLPFIGGWLKTLPGTSEALFIAFAVFVAALLASAVAVIWGRALGAFGDAGPVGALLTAPWDAAIAGISGATGSSTGWFAEGLRMAERWFPLTWAYSLVGAFLTWVVLMWAACAGFQVFIKALVGCVVFCVVSHAAAPAYFRVENVSSNVAELRSVYSGGYNLLVFPPGFAEEVTVANDRPVQDWAGVEILTTNYLQDADSRFTVTIYETASPGVRSRTVRSRASWSWYWKAGLGLGGGVLGFGFLMGWVLRVVRRVPQMS